MGFKIDSINIGIKYSPYIIAEMSGNHNNSLDKALEIVEEAASSKVNAIKLQTYTADTMTLDIHEGDFLIQNKSSPWYNNSLYNLYKKASTPWEWHKPIMEKAKGLGLSCFSSPFDESAVDFLESLNVPAYKISSFECIDIPLIKKVASTGKPMIISTGMANIAEIFEAIETARNYGCKDLAILKCTSTYPSSPKDSNLKTISHLRDLFQCEVGLSDHTIGIGAAIASVAFGSTIIEKHLTLSRAEGGVDSLFSLEPKEIAALVRESSIAQEAIGKIHYGPTSKEENSSKRRRSLYFAKDLSPGETVEKNNLRSIRPGKGLEPKFYDLLIGKKVKKSIKKGTPASWEHFI